MHELQCRLGVTNRHVHPWAGYVSNYCQWLSIATITGWEKLRNRQEYLYQVNTSCCNCLPVDRSWYPYRLVLYFCILLLTLLCDPTNESSAWSTIYHCHLGSLPWVLPSTFLGFMAKTMRRPRVQTNSWTSAEIPWQRRKKRSFARLYASTIWFDLTGFDSRQLFFDACHALHNRQQACLRRLLVSPSIGCLRCRLQLQRNLKLKLQRSLTPRHSFIYIHLSYYKVSVELNVNVNVNVNVKNTSTN